MIELFTKLSIRLVVIRKHFKTKGYIEGGTVVNNNGESVDLSVLPAFLRTLLVTDGTVTKSIEAFYWEPIEVISVTQDMETVPKRKTVFDSSIHQQFLHREVQLKGKVSGTVYATADSYICIGNLPEHIASRLIANEIGIGELLRDEGLESYREIFDFGIDQKILEAGKSSSEVAYRKYVININGANAIEITEYFPIACYQ